MEKKNFIQKNKIIDNFKIKTNNIEQIQINLTKSIIVQIKEVHKMMRSFQKTLIIQLKK